jgi:hypothetical protein
MSDVPYGVLLSGGLDSSVISAITAKFARQRIESGDTQEAWYPRLHSFAVGLVGSPDLQQLKKQQNISVLFTMKLTLPFRKVWMLFVMLFIIWKLMM